MKGQGRTMIVIGAIFIILFSMWILIGDRGGINLWNRIQNIGIFLEIVGDYIYKERTWTIPTLTALTAIAIAIATPYFSKKHKPSVSILYEKSMGDAFEEEHITTLELEKDDHQALST